MKEDCSKRWERSIRTDEQPFVDEDCADSRSDVDDLRTDTLQKLNMTGLD